MDLLGPKNALQYDEYLECPTHFVKIDSSPFIIIEWQENKWKSFMVF